MSKCTTSIQMLRKHYWTTVFVATILPAILAGFFEYPMSGGTSGWVPLWAGLASGILTAAVLFFIQAPEPGKPGESGNDRIFINKPHHELTKQIKGLTSVAAKPVIERYKGAWINARGEIHDVDDRGDTVAVYLFEEEEPGIVLHFKKNKWFHKLKMLDRGESINVTGQIDSISERMIWLENCELVDSEI